MSKKIFIIGIVVAAIVFTVTKFMSCLRNIELNTVNPQISGSILEARKNGFFLSEYKLAQTDLQKGIILNDTWVEYVWKNTLKDGKRIKEKLGGIQLVMKTNSMEGLGFSDSTFLINWQIEVTGNQLQGSGRDGNGIYVNYLASKNPPDTIKVNVTNTARGDTTIYKPFSFLLVKQ
jgi:hypothetical protein